MFRLFRRIFKKKVAILSSIQEEFYHTDFSKSKTQIWKKTVSDDYSLDFSKSGLAFTLKSGNILAWQEEEILQAKDFWLESFIQLPKIPTKEKDSTTAGSCAFGFLFRFIDDGDYYLVLISDKGFVRMDVVFNGTPTPLLAWTKPEHPLTNENTEKDSSEQTIKDDFVHFGILARDTRFTLVINDHWVADIEDDTILSGGQYAIAAQNWTNLFPLSSTISAFSVDTRLLRIEEKYQEILANIKTSDRIRLANRLIAVNRTMPALLQIKKAEETKDFTNNDRLEIAQIYCASKLLPEAIEILKPVLTNNDDNNSKIKALELYAGALYLNSKIDELLEILNQYSSLTKESAPLLTLEGNAFFEKQEWEKAALSYEKALYVSPDSGLLLLHQARALDKEWLSGFRTNQEVAAKTIDIYQKAATQFLNDEEYQDLDAVIDRLLEIDKDDPITQALAGKFFYAIQDIHHAKKFFTLLIKQNTNDSAIWYLMGLISRQENKAQDSFMFFKKAVELAPEYSVYHFRLGESYLNNFKPEECDDIENNEEVKNAIDEALKAINLDSEYGWAWNLLGTCYLFLNNFKDSEKCLEKARKILPEEIDVLENYAELFRRTDRFNQILPILNPENEEADFAAITTPDRAWNLIGNLYSQENNFIEALKSYDKAISLDSKNSTFLINKASVCLQIDDINQADILLSKAYEIKTSPDLYDLIGYTATRKGDYARAQVSYRQGLQEFPGDFTLLFNLANLYLIMLKHSQAEEVLKTIIKQAEISDKEKKNTVLNEKIKELSRQIKSHTHRFISCNICHTEWEVPFDIPWQKPLRLMAEPPDSMPAGKCVSCGKVYCIGCGKKNMDEEGRFLCPDCGTRLKLADEGLIWILQQWIQSEEGKKKGL